MALAEDFDRGLASLPPDWTHLDLDLRILERFKPEREFVLEAGDMLYLPPGVAHCGVAESECLTWSIGFRAPGDDEIVTAFLDFLREKGIDAPGA